MNEDTRMIARYADNIEARKARARLRSSTLLGATLLAVLFLVLLIVSIVDQSFGYVLLEAETPIASLERGGVPLELQDAETLRATLEENLSPRRYANMDAEKPFASRSREELHGIVMRDIVVETPRRVFRLGESLLGAGAIRALRDEEYPEARLVFRSWINARLLTGAQSSEALWSGLRGAALGSLMTIVLSILLAFPVGVAAAIWLEEYARPGRLNRTIQLAIYNLAGVPSIIYGMLGLAVFVRAMEPITSGAIFGAAAGTTAASAGQATGRTLLSASLTLAILVLPVIIINAQEALRAVPQSLRHAGLALGATPWQTTWHHVLPASMDRILTGTVLAMSRALGETAPLVVVGAATFLSTDPTGPFSRFTTLPIQIYQWTSRPQAEFKSLAAAAILVLLVLLLSLNAAAIIMRNRLGERKRAGL